MSCSEPFFSSAAAQTTRLPSDLDTTPNITQTCDEPLTFDPDVAVPLEVVVGGFPGVAVVAQECDRWAGPYGDVTHSFLVCRKERKRKEEEEEETLTTETASRAGKSAVRHSPTYSLGGDSRRSERTLTGRPGAFSSSVLLVSTISLSSVEMTCCCFRGFFLGEAPGIRSPGAGAPRAETGAVAAWPDDKLGLPSGSEP